MPVLRPILAAESLPLSWPNVTQWHHTVALGPMGTGMGKKPCLSIPLTASCSIFTLYSGYFKATKGDLVSTCKLRGEKGCHYSLKPGEQTYQGQGLDQLAGEEASSLRSGVGIWWDQDVLMALGRACGSPEPKWQR